MKWESQLKVPFESGELVRTRFADGEPFVGEVRWTEGDRVVLRFGHCPCAWRLYSAPRWYGLELVRPAVRGYPYERKVPGIAWTWFWFRNLPWRLRRRLCG